MFLRSVNLSFFHCGKIINTFQLTTGVDYVYLEMLVNYIWLTVHFYRVMEAIELGPGFLVECHF